MVEPRIPGPRSAKKDKIVIRKRKEGIDTREEEQYYPVTIDKVEYIPSTATWRAYCGDYEEAIKLFEQVRHRYITGEDKLIDYRVFFNLGYCYNAIEWYEDALIEFDVCTYLQPWFIKGHYMKAQVLTVLKRYKEAEKSLVTIHRMTGGSDEEVDDAIKNNIYEALINNGHDEERAGFGSAHYPTIEEAEAGIANYETNMALLLIPKLKKYREYWKRSRELTWTLWHNVCRRKLRENQQETGSSACITS